MTKQLSPYQDKIHKHILRDRFLSSFKQPGRFRAELEKSEADAEGERS